MNEPSRRVGTLLTAVPALKAISVQLETAATLQGALSAALPGNLAANVKLLHCEAGVAVLVAGGSAAAARLRMLAPRVTQSLQAADARVREIRIVVDVVRQSPTQREPDRRLDATAMDAWRRLASSLPEGSLREACRRLIRAQANSVRQEKPLEGHEGEYDSHHE